MGVTLNTGQLSDVITFSNGNIGIGGSPSGSYKFEVNGNSKVLNNFTISSTTNAGLIAATNSTTGYAYIDIINNGASGKNYQIGLGGNAAAAGYANNLYFDLVGVGTIITLTSGRNVGIGTTSTGFNVAGLPLVIGSGSGNTGMTIFSGNTSSGSIHFADTETTGGGSYAGFINYDHTANSMQFGTTNTERMRIHSNGQISINATTSRGYKLNLNSGSDYAMEIRQTGGDNNYIPLTITHEFTSGTRAMITFQSGGYGVSGTITSGNTTTSYNTSSDYRLKQDLRDYNGLQLVQSIKTYDFEWKADNSRMYGVMAHELQDILPIAVVGVKDAVKDDGTIIPQGVDYSKIVPVLVKAIQELSAKVSALENKS